VEKYLDLFYVAYLERMATSENVKNEAIFSCNLCDFITSKKKNFENHTQTQKHIRNSLATFSNSEATEKIIKCDKCRKIYKDRTGLWRHKKKCFEIISMNNNNDEISDKELIIMLLKQNSQLIEQNADFFKNGTNNNNNNNSHNNNSHNKTFNLQFFLNETCKDAMNIMDFVDSIKLQLSDLENVGKVGYVEGISNIITTNLKALDVTQRPVHCTDKKRETLYIKDENKWEKEDEEKKRIKKVIKRVVSKNQRLLPKFKEAHPDCIKASSLFSDQYNKIIIESMGGSGDNDIEKEEKIIKNIAKNVTLDKVCV
jgi:hypothetical protein